MTLLLHVLMLSLLSGGSARVVPDFEKECGQFFAGGKSPTRFTGQPQYRQICQTQNNLVYFATYYDTNNKIPVYSAYRFAGIMGCERKNNWLIEPQLDDDDKLKPNMASEGTVNKDLRGIHQALSEDYKKSGYDKGHLEPVYQAQSQDCAYATFTLTNAAPQNPSFNRGQWKELEQKMAKELSKQCSQYFMPVFMVTGVVPDTPPVAVKPLNNRVNVPSHFWTAYCCLDQNNKCQIAGGFIGENENNPPKEKTLNALEKELTELYKVTFKVFASSTVSQSAKTLWP